MGSLARGDEFINFFISFMYARVIPLYFNVPIKPIRQAERRRPCCIIENPSTLALERLCLSNQNSILLNSNLTWDKTNSTLNVDGGVTINKLGSGLSIAAGTNGTLGTATLINGECTVFNTSVKADSCIFLNGTNDNGGFSGFLRAINIVPGVSFFVISGSSEDVSTFAYIIVQPA